MSDRWKSNKGSFKPWSDEQFRTHFWGRCVAQTDGCWLYSGSVERTGYGRVKRAGKKHMAHRMAYLLANGEIPDEMVVCHKCDVRLCCNPAHLFIGTRNDNTQDAVSKQRHAQGERCNHNKLTAEQVQQIRLDWRASCGAGPLARLYGVSREQIYNVVKRRSWKHVP